MGYTKEILRPIVKHDGINHIGERFGKLLVVKLIRKTENSSSIYLCKCDCGNDTEVHYNSLISGRTTSCCCVGYNTGKKEKGQWSFTSLFNSYKSCAKKRGLIFSLNREEFKNMTKQNCFYCGKEPSNIFNTKGSNGCYIYNGIDRVDNTKGYILDNCVTCCELCNRMKLTLPLNSFLEHILKIYSYSIETYDNR